MKSDNKKLIRNFIPGCIGFDLQCAVILAAILCAGCASKNSNTEPAWQGVWRSVRLNTDLTEFRDARQIELKVYRMEVLSGNETTNSLFALVTAELITVGPNNRRQLPFLCYPMTMTSTTLCAGPMYEGLCFDYVLESGRLQLIRRTGNSSFVAAFKKVSRNPGDPEFLPTWAR